MGSGLLLEVLPTSSNFASDSKAQRGYDCSGVKNVFSGFNNEIELCSVMSAISVNVSIAEKEEIGVIKSSKQVSTRINTTSTIFQQQLLYHTYF